MWGVSRKPYAGSGQWPARCTGPAPLKLRYRVRDISGRCVALAGPELHQNLGLVTDSLGASPTSLPLEPALALALAASLVPATQLAFRRKVALMRVQHPNVHLPLQPEAAAFHERVLARCPTIRAEYRRPFWGLLNGFLETTIAAQYRHLPDTAFTRECLRMHDGGTVTLDWAAAGISSASTTGPLPEDAPLLLLLSGLGGGSNDNYVRHNVEQATARGFRVVVLNCRGTAGSPVTSPKFFSAAFTDDLVEVVGHVEARYPQAPLLAAGWSLGANLLVRYLAEQGARSPIKAAVSMCNPFDLGETNTELSKGLGRLFDVALANSLRTMLLKNMHVWEGHTGPERWWEIERATSVKDLEDAIVVQSFGYDSVDDYYERGSCAASIPHVRVPLLCLQALDDPIAPERAIPYQALAGNPYCALVTTPAGGHIGWMAGDGAPWGHAWSDTASLEWLESITLELKQAKAEKNIQLWG